VTSTLDNSAEEGSDMEDEEEEEEAATNWNRAEAERIYAATRSTLNEIYPQ